MENKNSVNLTYLLLKTGAMYVGTNCNVKGMMNDYKIPIGFAFQKICEEKTIATEMISGFFAREILEKSRHQKIHYVGGSIFTERVTRDVSDICGIKLLSMAKDTLQLKGKNVSLIVDVLATGMNTEEMVRIVEKAGGKVAQILCIFDFGLYLNSKKVSKIISQENASGVVFKSLINTDDVIEESKKLGLDAKKIIEWRDQKSQNLLRLNKKLAA